MGAHTRNKMQQRHRTRHFGSAPLNDTTTTTSASNGENTTHSDDNATEGSVVVGTAFLPLQDRILPKGDYIHLYNATLSK
jgi:hypothetical protein